MSRTRINGLRELQQTLKNLPKGTQRATLVRFGTKRLEPMRDTAKAAAPVADGELRDSIEIGTRQASGRELGVTQRKRRFADKASVELNMGPTEKGYPQAVPQEMGSINNPPAGYMRKAWDQHSGQLLEDLAQDLGQAIDAAAKRYASKLARRAAKGG